MNIVVYPCLRWFRANSTSNMEVFVSIVNSWKQLINYFPIMIHFGSYRGFRCTSDKYLLVSNAKKLKVFRKCMVSLFQFYFGRWPDDVNRMVVILYDPGR